MRKVLAIILSAGLIFGIAYVGGVKNTTETTNVKAAKLDPPVGG